MNREQAHQMIDQHVNALMEHFSSVQILATCPAADGDGTEGHSRGGGDWYARFGIATEFVQRGNAVVLAQEIRE